MHVTLSQSPEAHRLSDCFHTDVFDLRDKGAIRALRGVLLYEFAALTPLAGKSRYGATVLEYDCGRLHMVQIFLCPRCSKNAIKQNAEGKKAIEQLLAFVTELKNQGATH